MLHRRCCLEAFPFLMPLDAFPIFEPVIIAEEIDCDLWVTRADSTLVRLNVHVNIRVQLVTRQ